MLQIANLTIEDNVLLAPMSGVTDLPFRRLVKKFGASLVISEMIASRAMILKTRQSLQKCQKDKIIAIDTDVPELRAIQFKIIKLLTKQAIKPDSAF